MFNTTSTPKVAFATVPFTVSRAPPQHNLNIYETVMNRPCTDPDCNCYAFARIAIREELHSGRKACQAPKPVFHEQAVQKVPNRRIRWFGRKNAQRAPEVRPSKKDKGKYLSSDEADKSFKSLDVDESLDIDDIISAYADEEGEEGEEELQIPPMWRDSIPIGQAY